MKNLNYPIAYAPMSIRYPDEEGYMIHIGYIPNLCYIVGLEREYYSDGTYKSRYKIVFVDKIIDFENKKIESIIPNYEGKDFRKYCCNFEYMDDITFDYKEAVKICETKNTYLYSARPFTFEEKMKYLNKLDEHKNLLIEKHNNNYDYKKLYYKMKNGDAKI